MNVVVYTAIFGQSDNLLEPTIELPGVRLVAFSDIPRASKHWEVKSWSDIADTLPDNLPGHAAPLSRFFKLLPHRHFPDADYTIWIDGSDILRGDPTELIPFEEDMLVFGHLERDCVYQELRAILRYRKDSVENVQRAMNRYRSLRVPEHVGLATCSVIWCRRCQGAIDFCERWWTEFLACGMKRDQPPWGYCNWVNPCKTRFVPGDHMKNKYVKRLHHRRRVPA